MYHADPGVRVCAKGTPYGHPATTRIKLMYSKRRPSRLTKYHRSILLGGDRTCSEIWNTYCFVFQGKLDPKKLQLQLTGFLEKSTGMFMEELWGLLVDAQSSLGGIPSAFLQDKKQEMLQAKVFG